MENGKSKIPAWLPACLTFGPAFMVIVSSQSSILAIVVGGMGALMTIFGLTHLSNKVAKQAQQIEKLQDQLNGRESKPL